MKLCCDTTRTAATAFLVTHGLMEYIWEKVDLFNIQMEINNMPLKIPREGHTWCMLEFVSIGYVSNELLLLLNRVWKHQQVMFISDVLYAAGKNVDMKYLTQRQAEEKWSTLRFQNDQPPWNDFKL